MAYTKHTPVTRAAPQNVKAARKKMRLERQLVCELRGRITASQGLSLSLLLKTLRPAVMKVSACTWRVPKTLQGVIII